MSQAQSHPETRDPASVELGLYLQWAMGSLGFAGELNQLRWLSPPDLRDFASRIRRAMATFLVTTSPNQPSADSVLDNPDYYFGIDTFDEEPIQVQAIRQERMLGSMVLVILGERRGYEELGAMLVTENLNRKMAIGRLLSLTTDGQIGLSDTAPSKQQVKRWARLIAQREVPIRSRLEDISKVYFQ